VATRIQIFEGDFFARQRIIDDPNPTIDDEKNIRGIALPVNDLLVIAVTAPSARFFHRLQSRRCQSIEDTNIRERCGLFVRHAPPFKHKIIQLS
jgi:hypothetical protein